MKVLLHVCCGPCSIYPVEQLRKQGYDITGYFYNPNIHPFKEYRRRFDTLQDFAQRSALPLLADEQYGLKEFVRKVAYNEENRCRICYLSRLEQTVKIAVSNSFEAFSTTLLYSTYQDHTLLKETCENFAKQYNISFIYQDFRKGWQLGIDSSIEQGMYRQPYCGCIYSEQERYDKSLRK